MSTFIYLQAFDFRISNKPGIMEQFVKTWTPELIKNIVQHINSGNIVPIVGPNVFYVLDNGEKKSVQEYVVRELLHTVLPEEFNEQRIPYFSDGVKGMSRLNRLFDAHKKTLNNYLYSLYNDNDFLSKLSVDSDVLAFLQYGQFPLIITTCPYCLLETLLTYHGRRYDTVSYRKRQVSNEQKEDITLKDSINEITRPAVFHLMGIPSVQPKNSVITEDDFLMFLHCLQDTNTRPKNLNQYMKLENKKYIFTLGCDIPDWTFKLLLYSLKANIANEMGIRDADARDDYFVGGVVDFHLSNDVTEFLLDIGYFPGTQLSQFLQDINKQLTPEVKPRVFLSLCSEEYERIGEPLYRILSERFDVWFYKYNGDQHAYWNDPERGIEAGLKTSDFILPVITPSAIDKIDDYETSDLPNDDVPGLIEEWRRAKLHGIRCCPLYVGRDVERLKKSLKKSECRELLWDFFFSEEGNAGLPPIELDTFTAEDLYHHLENHIKS